MNQRQPWHCPGCQKYHAPHVDTCPGPVYGPVVIPDGAPTIYPPNWTGTPLPAQPYASGTWKYDPDNFIHCVSPTDVSCATSAV